MPKKLKLRDIYFVNFKLYLPKKSML